MQTPITVLIVDDSPSYLDAVRCLLESNGFKTLCAANAMEAFELLNSQAIDLMFLDYKMPDIDGYEVALRVRKTSPKNRDIPIVIATSTTDAKEAEKFITLGVQGYLLKPFSDESLLLIIDKIITGIQKTDPMFPLLLLSENELISRFSGNEILIKKKLRELALFTGLETSSSDASTIIKRLHEKKLISRMALVNFQKLSELTKIYIYDNNAKRGNIMDGVILQTEILQALDKRIDKIMEKTEVRQHYD